MKVEHCFARKLPSISIQFIIKTPTVCQDQMFLKIVQHNNFSVFINSRHDRYGRRRYGRVNKFLDFMAH